MKVFEPKLFTAFKGYKSKDYISDIVAGIIVAIIALPLSIALAIASEATPEMGLFTAIIAGLITALLGGSKVNITGPTAAFATIVAGIILSQGFDGLFLATIMAGVLLIVMGLLRVGSLIKFIPHTITVGFTGGIAVTLVVGQLKDFLGLTYPAGTVAIETIDKLKLVFENISTFNIWAFVIGLIGVLILVFWPKISKKIPGSLIAVLVGALICLIPIFTVNTIGSLYTISSSLPTFSFPTITGERLLALLPSAFTIALLAGIESLLSCVVSDKMINDKHNSNTELIALGAGNILVGCFGGIPATGAIARTAANVKNGGKSPLAGIIHAVVLLLVLVLLMPLASYIPMPIIAAILFIVAYNMSEWRSFVAIIKTKKWNDILVLLVTFALTVIFDLVKAIAVGIAIHYLIVLIKFIIAKKKAKEESTKTEENITEEKEENIE
ncbi:MAG: sodium-independent anion transporter [Clostridia bacterium]|nr:sodium-independent anion transporter [Clostridia bacterium]